MSTVEFSLTRDEARWLAVIASGLDRRPFRRRANRTDILDTIKKLGMVQLDTISVISRSHETVLWSRLGPYDTDLITSLYDPDLALTEYLAHAAAIIPSDTLFLFRTFMERVRAREDWAGEPQNRAVMDSVLQRITKEGPTASRHFDRTDDGRRAEQWEWYGLKPERRALDALWLRGETMLRQRDKGFSRVFDLPDRVIPGFWEAEPIADDDRDRQFVRKAMSALGVGTHRWVSDYFRTGGPAHVPLARSREILEEMAASGEVVRADAPGIPDPVWLDGASAERVDELRKGRLRPSLTTLLSPFDNLTWNRDRGAQLFDFEYRIECYTPEPKRKYGYYSMPILYRGRIIGRLDPSYNRKTGLLTIKALHLEPGVRPSATMAKAIAATFDDLLTFLGGTPGSWVLLTANPPEIIPLMSSVYNSHPAI